MAGWFVCLFVLPLITRPCSQLQSVSNFSKFVHPRFLLRCWLFYMPFCNALSSYFLKLKSFTQFDGDSDSLKCCKRFRDTAPLTAEANNYEASNCQTVCPVGNAFRQNANYSSLVFKFFLTVQISCWLFSDKPVVRECSKKMFSMFAGIAARISVLVEGFDTF